MKNLFSNKLVSVDENYIEIDKTQFDIQEFLVLSSNPDLMPNLKHLSMIYIFILNF